MATVFGAVQFIANQSGLTGLATAGMVDVYAVAKATGALAATTSNVNAVEIGQGFYSYALAGANTTANFYLAVFTTAEVSADQKQIGVWLADIAEQAAADVVDANVDLVLEDTGTTLDALVKDIPTNAELATALGSADDAVLAAIAALNNLSAAGAQAAAAAALAAYGVALETTAQSILADTNELQTDWHDGGRLDLLLDASNTPTTAAIADAVLDEVVEGAYTMRQFLRLFAAMLLGKATGGSTPTLTFRDVGDTKNRIVMTVDTDGNRSAVVLDGA